MAEAEEQGNLSDSERDPASELAEIAGSLRAYLLWQLETGATGMPRDPTVRRRLADPSPPIASTPPLTPSLAASISHAEPSEEGARPTDASAARLQSSEQHDPNIAPTSPLVRLGLDVHAAATLAELEAAVKSCSRCILATGRKQTVFSRGTGSSGICFVGEGPGADEDEQGQPFVGAAGQLLDRMITAMGLERDEVYVCNIVKCRPPDNRTPQPDEILACSGYLHRQLELLAPQVIVALGATALEGLLGKTGGIKRHRGQFSLYRARIAVMPTFHPAYLLREPGAKREVWSDLQKVLLHVGRDLPTARK